MRTLWFSRHGLEQMVAIWSISHGQIDQMVLGYDILKMVFWLEQGCWKHRIRIFFCYGNNETRWRKPWWKNWPDRHIHFAANFPTNCPKVRFSIILTYPDQGSVGREGAKKIWVAGYGWDEDRMAQTRASSNGGFTEPCLRLKLDEFFNKKLVINCILFTRL